MSEVNASHEALSALIDGEATELDVARVLKSVDDPELRAHWARQQVIGEVLRGETKPRQTIDVSRKVRAVLEEKRARRGSPLTGLAVAASVTLAVVFGGQQLLSGEVPAAVGNLPGGVVSLGSASAMQASFGSQRSENVLPAPVERVTLSMPVQSTSARYERLAAEKLQQLGVQHASASASLQPSTLVPYARVTESPR